MAEIPFKPYTDQGKLRFWCQKVLPLVYDDSLSYYELLGKIVEYLNNTIKDVSACEDNITALRDAFIQLQDYVNEMFDDFSPEVERIIDEMIDSGEFGEIVTDVVNGLIANEYSTTQGYAQFDYVLKDGKLYCATASTSGEWDETKWRETTVGADMQLLNQRVYNLNAGQVAYNNNASYNNNTVGKALQNLDSRFIELGVITASSREEAIEKAYRKINVTDKPVLFHFEWSGNWSGIAYKYFTNTYGTIYATYPVNGASYFGYLINDVFYVDMVARESEITTLSGSLNTILGKTITYERKADATSDISTPAPQGVYIWYITSSTPDNFGEGGVILVIAYADWIQAQLGYGNSGKMYFRQYNSGAWTAWKTINTDTAPIIPPPDFYNSVKKATPQLDGTISSFVADASGWYQARAVNRSVSGQCETNICNSNGGDVYSANYYPEGTYRRAPSTWMYYKLGQTIYYRIWATDSDYSGLFYAPSIT